MGLLIIIYFWRFVKKNSLTGKKRLIVSLTFLALMGILIGLIGFAEQSVGSRCRQFKARDARRESDIRQINIAMDMYYKENGQYVQSIILPNKIGDYLELLPKDPGNGPCSSYQWISNVNNPQKYCIYACLEEEEFFVASHEGIEILEEAPANLDCW